MSAEPITRNPRPPRIVMNDPQWINLQTIGVAVRAGEHHGVHHTTGRVACAHCGGNLGSIARIASVIGVGSSSLSSWLNRRPVRPDIAEKIRAAFASVSE